MSRYKAREAAFTLLYEWEANKHPDHDPLKVLEESVTVTDIEAEDVEYIRNLVDGCKTHCLELDETIDRLSVDWKVERIPRVDLALLRLGIYEMKYDSSVPNPSTIDHCVELAKRYSTDKSGAYVNGLLSSVNKEIEQ